MTRTSEAYEFAGGYPTPETITRASEDAALARAVTAYRFWYPTVSVEGIFNGNREIGLLDNQAIGCAATKPRQVGFTLNSDTPYGAAEPDPLPGTHTAWAAAGRCGVHGTSVALPARS